MTDSERSARRDDLRKVLPMPEQHVVLRVNRVYAPGEMEHIRRGVLPKVMEDKWFIFYENDTLYMHRSWTGVCVYQADFVEDEGGAKVSRLLVNRDPQQYTNTDDDFDARQFVFLVDILLLEDYSQPPPMPNNDQRSKEQQAIGLWTMIGRAMFGRKRRDE